MVSAMLDAGVPASISNSAGTFICNEVTYRVQHWLAQHRAQLTAGFIHLPYLPEQTLAKYGVPAMGLETQVVGVRAAIEAAIASPTPATLTAV
jgi:pyroglutamyl-peptidase